MASLLNQNGKPSAGHDPQKNKSLLSTILLVARWSLAVFFLTGIFMFFPSVSSVLFLLLAVLTAPIKPLERFIREKLHLKKASKSPLWWLYLWSL